MLTSVRQCVRGPCSDVYTCSVLVVPAQMCTHAVHVLVVPAQMCIHAVLVVPAQIYDVNTCSVNILSITYM